MNEEDDPYHEDELVNIKLPRSQYDLLKKLLHREQAYSWFSGIISSSWVWVVAGGLFAVWGLYDKIHLLFNGK